MPRQTGMLSREPDPLLKYYCRVRLDLEGEPTPTPQNITIIKMTKGLGYLMGKFFHPMTKMNQRSGRTEVARLTYSTIVQAQVHRRAKARRCSQKTKGISRTISERGCNARDEGVTMSNP